MAVVNRSSRTRIALAVVAIAAVIVFGVRAGSPAASSASTTARRSYARKTLPDAQQCSGRDDPIRSRGPTGAVPLSISIVTECGGS